MNWQQDTSALPHRRVAALMIAAGILTQQAVLGQTQPSRAPGQWNDTLCALRPAPLRSRHRRPRGPRAPPPS